VKLVVRIESVTGATIAPPSPWKPRARISASWLWASPAGERGDREQQQPEDEHPPVAEQVGGAPAQQQEAGEDEHVGVDHPLEVDGREAQVGPDRRQRHVDHRDVEHDHELGQAAEREDPAAMQVLGHADAR
jgi:hypothetical protein